jgi:hypothetical protein
MKQSIKKIFSIVFILVTVGFALSGCYETHYYHRYHHHTRDWYDRRHESYPAGVDFNIDIR